MRKLLNRMLYEEAGDQGSGGGGGGGSGDAGAAGGGDAGASGGNLLDHQGSQGQGGQGDAGGDKGAQGAGSSDPFFVGLYDSTGKMDKTKFDNLPDHLKPHAETFKKYDTFESFLAGVGNLSLLAGKKGLEPLPADAPDEIKEERNGLMRKLNGVPDTIEGYGIKKPDDLADEQWDGKYVDSMLGILHKHNASPDLVKELVAADTGAAKGKYAESDAQIAANEKAEFGKLEEAFGTDLQAKLGLASRAAATFGLDPKTHPIFKHADSVIAFTKIAEAISDDKLVSGEDGGNGGGDREKALSIVNDPANPLHKAYHSPEDPRHQQALDQVSAFNQRHFASKKK